VPSLVNSIVPEWAGGVAFKRGKEKEKTQDDRDQVRVSLAASNVSVASVWSRSAPSSLVPSIRECWCDTLATQ
jgi:hypothetical protein